MNACEDCGAPIVGDRRLCGLDAALRIEARRSDGRPHRATGRTARSTRRKAKP